ncbi:MAG: hypothetical protein PVJ57_10320 [Phycisphaerae bacterium]|jgi:hypothetical protein
MVESVVWQDCLRDLAGFIKRVAYRPPIRGRSNIRKTFNPARAADYYVVSRRHRRELLERARRARDAMANAGLVPPLPGDVVPADVRHRAYELIEELILEVEPTVTYGPARKRTPITSNMLSEAPVEYETAFRDAIAVRGATPGKRRGRPADTDAAADAKIARAWEGKRWRTYAELAQEKGLTERAVRLAIDRDRKRRARKSVK